MRPLLLLSALPTTLSVTVFRIEDQPDRTRHGQLWAHVYPVQYSGTAVGDEIKLDVDTPGRVARRFKLDGSAAKAAIQFDAILVREFDK